MDTDPISQFFPDEEDVDLYAVLGLDASASTDDIKKSYRRLALVHHPDKHATSTERQRTAAAHRFQQIGFAYAVLGDLTRRQRYDTSGRTDEGLDFDKDAEGWQAYFEEMFERVTRGRLDEMKKEYQGSDEELADLKSAYLETEGSLEDVMQRIPHSTHEDEARFIRIIAELVSRGDIPRQSKWEASTRDEKARLVRASQAKKEAGEAEELARELGVWEEFYGDGKEGPRKGRGKGSAKSKGKAGEGPEEDTSVLQALILKRKKNMDGFFDNLAAKYATEPPAKPGKKGKKRARVDEHEDEDEDLPKKKGKATPPDIDDEEFARLQTQMFGNNAKFAPTRSPKEKRANTKGKKVK